MRLLNALLLNDVHVGAVRSAGTTIKTRAAIQQYLLDSMAAIILEYAGYDLLINGDLFDGYEVDTGQVLAAYRIFHEWLTANPERILDLVLGNHDIAKNSQRTSSFALLCTLLKLNFGDRVNVYDNGLAQVAHKVWVIPHCLNQDAFNVELDKVLEVDEPGFLLLHANFDNNFAIEADHSLNVDEGWARRLTAKGWVLVFAHEHQRRFAMAGNVVITGNQWPTSVADCLTHGEAQKDGKKFAHLIETIEDFGTETTNVTLRNIERPTWDAATDFAEMDWRDLLQTEARFVRVTGTADAGEAADMINAIARYRNKSEAFVITNGVKVGGIAGVEEMSTLSVERLQSVDVLKSLCEKLEPHEAKRVRDLLDPPEEMKEAA